MNVARELAGRQRLQRSTTSGTSWTWAGGCRTQPTLPDPLERPLDAARGADPGALHLAPGADTAGLGAALLAVRRAGAPAHLVDRRATPASRRWQAVAAGAAGRRTGRGRAVTSASPTTSRCSCSLGALALWALRTRAAGRPPGVRPRRARGGPGLSCRAMTACCWASPSPSRSWSTLVRRPRRPASSAGRPALAVRGRAVPDRRRALAAAPARGLRVPLALRGERPHPVDHRVPPALQHQQRPTTLTSFLGQGLGPLLASRPGGLTVGADHLRDCAAARSSSRRSRSSAPGRVGATRPSCRGWSTRLTLFAFSALLFAVHVPYGTFLHSAVALVPHAYLLRWWASRRWSPGSHAGARVGCAARDARVHGHGRRGRAARRRRRDAGRRCGRWQRRAGRSRDHGRGRARGRAGDGPRDEPRRRRATATSPGGPGIVTPDDPLPVVEEALRAYGIRWLVLERDHIMPALAAGARGHERPTWLSRPSWSCRLTARETAGGP